MTVTMFDSVDVSLLPDGNYAYAGYVDGLWPTYQDLKSKFPDADVLSIAVNTYYNADCLDIESGDATPEEAAYWYQVQIGNGAVRPCLYADVSTMPYVLEGLAQVQIPRNKVRLWSAHFGAGEHICGPDSCELISELMDGTQWTDAARGLDLDQSLLSDDFFDDPLPADWQKKIMSMLPVLKLNDKDSTEPHWYIHRVQAILNAVYGSKIAVDGIFGPETEAAVKALQSASHITDDGVVEANTWSVLILGTP